MPRREEIPMEVLEAGCKALYEFSMMNPVFDSLPYKEYLEISPNRHQDYEEMRYVFEAMLEAWWTYFQRIYS